MGALLQLACEVPLTPPRPALPAPHYHQVVQLDDPMLQLACETAVLRVLEEDAGCLEYALGMEVVRAVGGS